MKKIPILFLVLLFLFSKSAETQIITNQLKTDNIKLIVEYYFSNDLINDSIHFNGRIAKVFLGDNIYLTDIQLSTAKQDSAKIVSQLSSQGMKKDIQNMFLEKVDPTGTHLITVKKYGLPEFYGYVNNNDNHILVMDTALFSWTLSNQYKKIDSFTCQKANGKYGKDSVVAWFTEQIPLNSGPGIVYGLPGLIIEYYNRSTRTYYKVKSILNSIQERNKFKEYSNSVVMRKSEYTKLVDDEHKKAEKIKKMIQNGKIDNSQL